MDLNRFDPSAHPVIVGRRARRLLPGVLLAALLAFAPSPAVRAQEATPAALPAGATVVAAGLTNPRGFAWGPDGTLVVALAGTGGSSLPTEDAPLIADFGGFFGGSSAAVARIEAGCPVTAAAGLPSFVDGTNTATGASDVAFLGTDLYATVDGGGAVHGNPGQPAGVYRIGDDGTATIVADLSAWMRGNPVAHQPPADSDPDGEVFQLLPTADGTALWVVESNQGQLLRVAPDGTVARVADLSDGHPVPTGLAPAPDGGVYVGILTAFPYMDGAAKVFHVSPDGAVAEQWTGLTAVVSLAVGSDGALYALELATGSVDHDPFVLPGTGRVVRQTGPDAGEVVADGLDFPIGLGVGPDGALYVAGPAMGATPGGGSITRLATTTGTAPATPAPAPTCVTVPAGPGPAA